MSRLKEVWEESVEGKTTKKERVYPRKFDSYTVTEAPCILTDMDTGAKFDALNGNRLKIELDIPGGNGDIADVETLYFPEGHTVYVLSDDRKICEARYPSKTQRRLAVNRRRENGTV